MSSITGSCESPANLLFKHGLEKTLQTQALDSQRSDSQKLEIQQEKQTAALESEASSNNGSNQQNNPDQGTKGSLVDEFI